jgi:hypothetical protein
LSPAEHHRSLKFLLNRTVRILLLTLPVTTLLAIVLVRIPLRDSIFAIAAAEAEEFDLDDRRLLAAARLRRHGRRLVATPSGRADKPDSFWVLG